MKTSKSQAPSTREHSNLNHQIVGTKPRQITLASWSLKLGASLVLGAWCLVLPSVLAQGTAFTYQGRLDNDGLPATGNYDLRFSVWTAATGPAQTGVTLTNTVGVSNGLFTTTLDFGAGVFTGASRWLEIGVRTNAGGAFIPLTPRQQITSTPYAMYSATAATVPNGSITAAKLAAGAAGANLAADGQSAVASGGVVLSEQFNASDLVKAGYVKIGRSDLIPQQWLPGAAGPTGLPPQLARQGHSAVWTGSELIIWGGQDRSGSLLNTGARYHPVNGTWIPMSTNNAPAARTRHRAVWTGSEMIVWGGETVQLFGGIVITNTGARYNPTTGTWTAIAIGGGPRQDHSAFWTGSEMLVWGGTILSSGPLGSSLVPRNDGARYNLAGNSWSFISNTGTPSPRKDYSAVFTGTEMIIWGGRDSIGSIISTQTNFNDGARYNLAGNNWTPTTLSGTPVRRFSHSAAWSGTEMIVWGGQYAEGSISIVRSNFNDGARYNPAANSWSPMSTTGGPAARFGHDAIWAGNRMVIWGGEDGTNLFDSGARYFPAANTWSNMTFSGRPAPRVNHTTAWTGSEMIVWGGFNEFLRDLGGRYHPINDVWTATPPTGERSGRRGHTAIWAGSEILFWGGFDGERQVNTGGRYDPSLNSWTPIPTNGAPSGREGHRAVWTGTEMIIWGGTGPGFLNTGGRFNPTTGVWTALTTNGVPTGRNGHAAVWTGSQMVVWGGLDGTLANTGGRYNPTTDTWTATATSGAPSGRTGVPSIWTGSEMLVWGGVGGSLIFPFALSSGARYNPSANTWTALPTLNAPGPRTSHRAVWTGEDMLIWGGTDLNVNLNTGGRYNRAANTWSIISTNNAPTGRTESHVVWDGTRMIIWGGRNGTAFLNSGGLYDPVADNWLTMTNTPSGRAQSAAVWTGSEMVLHGGYSIDIGLTAYLDDTWHYTPPRTMYLYLKP